MVASSMCRYWRADRNSGKASRGTSAREWYVARPAASAARYSESKLVVVEEGVVDFERLCYLIMCCGREALSVGAWWESSLGGAKDYWPGTLHPCDMHVQAQACSNKPPSLTQALPGKSELQVPRTCTGHGGRLHAPERLSHLLLEGGAGRHKHDVAAARVLGRGLHGGLHRAPALPRLPARACVCSHRG